MKRIVFVILVAALIAPVGLMAQKVYKDAANRVILDMTDMAPSLVSSVAKYDAGPYNTTTITNGAYIGGNNTISSNENAKVYRKLQIAPKDFDGSGLSDGSSLSWQNAFLGCKNLNYNGTGWRLPTQRELMMMYVFRIAFDAIFTEMGSSVASPFGVSACWSATEGDTGNTAYYINFLNSYQAGVAKNSPFRVRCVREVTP